MSQYMYLNYASIILGIIAMAACVFGDVPEPHRTLVLYMMPVMLIVNYLSLAEIESIKKNVT